MAWSNRRQYFSDIRPTLCISSMDTRLKGAHGAGTMAAVQEPRRALCRHYVVRRAVNVEVQRILEYKMFVLSDIYDTNHKNNIKNPMACVLYGLYSFQSKILYFQIQLMIFASHNTSNDACTSAFTAEQCANTA